MILGILGLVLFPFLGMLAWYLARKAREEFASGGFDSTSRSMATAGLVMGIIGTIISVFWAIYMAAFLVIEVL